MKTMRNFAFLVLCAVWVSSPHLTRSLAARTECNAFACDSGFCGLDDENACGNLCSAFNSPEAPTYREGCEDYIYSNGGPTACIDPSPGTCPNPQFPALFTCDCAWDQWIPPSR